MAIKHPFNRQFLVKAAVALLSAAIIILTPIVLLDYNIEAALLEPAPYKEILADQKIYERLSGLIAGQFIAQLHGVEQNSTRAGFINLTRNSEPLLMNLDEEEFEKLISMMLPPEWAQVKLENILDQYFASMNNKIYRPNLLLAMNDIKGRLQGTTGLTVFVDLIRAQPPCSEQEKSAWQNGSLEDAPACFPSETILKGSEPKTSELLYQIAARMPDDASLDYFFGSFDFGMGDTSITRLQSRAAQFWNSRFLIRISPAFLLILLFLLGLFHKPGQTFTRLWAPPVILAGAASLVMAFVIWPVTNLAIKASLLPELPAYVSPELAETGASVAKAALGRITPFMMVQSILIILLGILLFFADRMRQRRLKLKKPSTKKYTLV